VEFAKYIARATEEIFNTMIFMEISAGDPFTNGKRTIASHVSAMIGLSGDFTGMLYLHCPEPVALAIAGAMLGMDLERIDTDVKDALGEITNMMAGGLKEALTAENIALEIAIPTAVSGQAYTISSPSGSERLVIPFTVEQGQFIVEMKYSFN